LGAAIFALAVVPGSGPAPSQRALVGYEDFSFASNGVKAPTGRKPEAAKLWFNDGTWWADMFRPARDAYTINRFDLERQDWVDTGTIIDDRNASRADVLWDGTHLNAISGGTDPTSSKHAAVFARFSYDPASRQYRMDSGYPVRVTEGGAETFVLARDDDGRLWVTFTEDQQVYVTHTLDTDRNWTVPFVLPVPQASDLTPDDIAAPVGFEGHVGVMWSDQAAGAMYFASHANGAPDDEWSVSAALQGPALADDHMNLKALRGDPAGLVFAVVKTSRNDAADSRPSDPLIVLLVLRRDGIWDQHVVGTVSDNQTRPLLMIDTDHRMLHVYMSAPCCSGGSIYTKTASLDAISFPEGAGDLFIESTAEGINNPTSTKQNLTRETGLLVLASDDKLDRYLHNWLALDGPPVAQPSPVPTLTAVIPSTGGDNLSDRVAPGAAWFSDGFENGSLDSMTSVKTGPDSAARVESDDPRSGLREANLVAGTADGAFAYGRWTLPSPQASLAVDMEIQVADDGPAGGNVPLLRLFDTTGDRLVNIYRQNGGDGRIWVATGSARVPTDGRLNLQTWTHISVVIDASGGANNATISVAMDGQPIVQAAIPAIDGPVISTVQVGNDTKNQPFSIDLDDVVIARLVR
jgi:hypothetical protein